VASWGLIWTTYKIVMPMAFTVMAVYAQYAMLFPGIIMHGNWTFADESNPWRQVAIVALWYFFDSLGNFAPTFCKNYLPSKAAIIILTLIKFGLVYTSMLCVERYNPDSPFWLSLWMQIVNLVLNALLGGLFGTWAMILGTTNPAQVGYSQKVAGFLLASHGIAGSAIGGAIGVTLTTAFLGTKAHGSAAAKL